MKRHERENLKNKKRADQVQKERDQSRTELNKTISLKEKLEKLCRELQKENNKLKVCQPREKKKRERERERDAKANPCHCLERKPYSEGKRGF